MTDIFAPLPLPCGQVLPNRLGKAAMEENQAEAGQLPGEVLFNLYHAWAQGGAGLILTGNVMVDPRAMTGPGGVVLTRETLEEPGARARFEQWAERGRSGAGKLVMQISHPGRQVYATQGTVTVSASATKVAVPGFDKMFREARALTLDEIRGQVKRFAETAQAAEAVGFDGVQIHAAHGYLVAQFLSPLTNLRDDAFGGSLENRSRFLLEIVRAVRDRVSPGFIVGVKLNSADFQRGGFAEADAAQVVEWLNAEAVDFVELSGGSYESTAMMGDTEDGRMDSTSQREAYFLDFVPDIAARARMPVMVTGGVTRRATAEAVLEVEGVELVGMARALAYRPDLPAAWARGEEVSVTPARANWKNKGFAGLAGMAMTKANLDRMGHGETPKANPGAIRSLIRDQVGRARMTKRYKAWLAERHPEALL